QLQFFTCLSKYNVWPSNPGSNVIHIKKANYGRTDETTCSSGRPAHQLSNTNCYAPTTLPIISERCEGRTTCLLQASNSIFSDPCFGTYKYLDISYSCVPPSKEPEHLITTILHYTPNTFSLTLILTIL
ncbi:L-rhamnose-binding lectin CSL3-like, partial [Clupea harengus]|uniref:L-rhamnose-binding lectin CSL3-like n=1 Tax=Clupea harengus TaxID=7950 RepID=A0A8M1KTS2_CLUHA